MAIRAGATRVELYNESTIVYLYDEVHRAALKAKGAVDVLTDQRPANARRLAAILAEGTLLAFLLAGDDPVVAEVVVGPPLSKDEMAGTRWLEPQQAFLRLPSGGLCLETVNSLRIHPLWPDRTEPGGRVAVPPGDYVLTLYRVDDSSPDDGQARTDGIRQVITLTPATTLPLPAERRAVLTWTDAAGREEKPAPKRVRGTKAFEGTLALPPGLESAESDLDLDDAETLGLRWGMRLEIETGGRRCEAVHLAHMNESYLHTLFGRDVTQRVWAPPPPPLLAFFGYSHTALKDVLRIEARRGLALAPIVGKSSKAATRVAFTLRVLPVPVMPAPDRALLRPPSVDLESLETVVLHCGDDVIALGVGRDPLEKIGARRGGALRARFAGGEERLLHWDPRMGSRWREALIEEYGRLPPGQEQRARTLERKAEKLFVKYVMGFDAVAKSSSAAVRVKEESERLKAEAAALRFPPERLRHVPLVVKEIHHWEANTPIVLAGPLVGNSNHLELDPGSPVVLSAIRDAQGSARRSRGR